MNYQIDFTMRIADFVQEYYVQKGLDITLDEAELNIHTFRAVYSLPDCPLEIQEFGETNTEEQVSISLLFTVDTQEHAEEFAHLITKHCVDRYLPMPTIIPKL